LHGICNPACLADPGQPADVRGMNAAVTALDDEVAMLLLRCAKSDGAAFRQLYDMQVGTRHGTWSPLMKAVVANLTDDDIMALAAYVTSRTP